MTDLIMPRRKFLTGLFSLAVASPAIVLAASLMPVKMFDYRRVWEIDYAPPPANTRFLKYRTRSLAHVTKREIDAFVAAEKRNGGSVKVREIFPIKSSVSVQLNLAEYQRVG